LVKLDREDREDLDAETRFLFTLGAAVRAAAFLDHRLRVLYCALVDSKYAALAAGGQ
jgi:hypothetical protein